MESQQSEIDISNWSVPRSKWRSSTPVCPIKPYTLSLRSHHTFFWMFNAPCNSPYEDCLLVCKQNALKDVCRCCNRVHILAMSGMWHPAWHLTLWSKVKCFISHGMKGVVLDFSTDTHGPYSLCLFPSVRLRVLMLPQASGHVVITFGSHFIVNLCALTLETYAGAFKSKIGLSRASPQL